MGYELHFKWEIDDKTFNILKGFISKYSLGFREYGGRLVIYTPKKNVNSLSIIV